VERHLTADPRSGDPSKKELKMLVLSRRIDENIVIGNDIRVYIVDIKGDTVKLGIEAPNNIPVHRSEVFQAIMDNRNPNFEIPIKRLPK